MSRSRFRLPAVALAMLAVLLLWSAACSDGDDDEVGGSTSSSSSTTAADGSTSTSAGGPREVLVYFVRDEKIGVASREVSGAGVGRAALEELVDGPSAPEDRAGLSTAVPEGTEVLGLDIDDGLATVDLSEEFVSGGGSLSMQLRVAQVVYTLTQFSTVDEVAFEIDGEPVDAIGGEGVMVDPPVDRATFEDVTPAILVEGPAVGMTLSSPLRLHGTANTFEAAFLVQVLGPSGDVLAEVPAMATSGTGTRGTFDLEVSFDVDRELAGVVVVYEESAADGSAINRVEIPVNLAPA